MSATSQVEQSTMVLTGSRLGRLLAAVRGVFGGSDERARDQRNALFVFVVRVASAGILYLSQAMLARWMGSHEYGVYVFVWTWVLVLGSVSTLGLPVVMLRLMPEYMVKGEHALLRGLLRFGQFSAVLTSTLVACIATVFVLALGEGLNHPLVLPAVLAFVCVPMFTLSDMLDGIGRSRGWMSVGVVPPYVLRPALLLLCMTIAHFAGWPVDALSAVVSAIIATWATAILQVILVNSAFKAELGPGERRMLVKPWLIAGAPLLLVSVSDVVMQSSDVLVISAFLSPVEVGMYFAVAKTMSLVMFVHYAVGSAVANRLSSLRAHGDREGLESMVKDAIGWTFWPSLFGTIIILAFGKVLLWIFNPQYTAAYPVMLVLAAGHLARASVGPADTILNMLGEQKMSAGILVTTAIVSLLLSLLLVPQLGLMGAATATASAYTCAAIASFIVARKRLGLHLSIVRKMPFARRV